MFLALFAVVFNFAFMLLYIMHHIPRDDYLFG